MKIACGTLVVALTVAVGGVGASKCSPRPPASSPSQSSGAVSYSQSSRGVLSSSYSTFSTSSSSSSSSVTSSSGSSSPGGATGSYSATFSGGGSTLSTTLSTSTSLTSSSGSVSSTSTTSASFSVTTSSSTTTISSLTTTISSSTATVSSSTATVSSSSISTTSSTISSSKTAPPPFNPTGYTYVNVNLPVVFDGTASSKLPATSTYTLQPADKTGPPACILDTANANTATIKITDNSNRRFVPKNSGSSVGVLDDSDFLGAGSPANNEQTSDKLVFRVTGPASNGRFDLGMSSVDAKGNTITYYIGYDLTTGDVIAALRRSDGTDDNYVTSIFEFTCDGKLVTKSPTGDEVTLKANPDRSGTLVVVSGQPYPEMQLFFVVSPPASSQAPAGKRSPTSSSTSHLALMPVDLTLSKRMSPYTDGTYPRLPSTPADMTARPRPGARQMGSTSFGTCGSGSTSPAGSLIFYEDFSSCCTLHSYCFDNCATGAEQLCSPGSLTGGAEQYCTPGQFERCNTALGSCAQDTVCEQIPWSTQPVRRSQCDLEVQYLRDAVATSAGGDVFDQATRDRCGGYCPGGAPFCGGMDAGQDASRCAPANDENNCEECGQSCNAAQGFRCASSKCACLLDTTADDKNCGACGNVCPKGTRCSGGSCVCAGQTCAGNVCVDTLTHPRNCGACGTVCESGYCSQGACVDRASLPPSQTGPDGCLATDAVKNGDFDTVTSSTAAPPWIVLDEANGGSISVVRRITGNSVAKYSLSTSGTATLTQTLTVCPGAAYALSYTRDTSGTGSLVTTLRWTAADGSAQERPLNWADFTGVADTSDDNNLRPAGLFEFTAPEGVTSIDLVLLGRGRNSRLPVQILVDEVSVYQP